MTARALTLLTAAAAALVLAAPAAPAAAATCRAGHGQRIVARSAQAVLLARTQPGSGSRLWGCSRRTGARRVLASVGDERVLAAPLLRGTHVGYVDADLGGAAATVVSDDAVRRGRRVAVATLRDRQLALRMGDDGALAWRVSTAAGQRLWLWRRGDTARLADEGFVLTGMRFTGRILRWRHGGAARAAAPPRADACPGTAGPGSTLAVDVVSSAVATVACWRATGRSAAFAAAPQAVAAAGSWVAVASGGTIVVRDLRDPRAAPRGVAATASSTLSGPIETLVVDEHGSLAWTFAAYEGGGHPPERLERIPLLHVDDGAGRRVLGATTIWYPIALARDGSALRWAVNVVGDAEGATRLVPRASSR